MTSSHFQKAFHTLLVKNYATYTFLEAIEEWYFLL